MKKAKLIAVFNKLWLLSITYLLLLILSFLTFLADIHFSVWIELALKATAILAFIVTLSWPLINLFPNFYSRKNVIKITAYLICIGYSLIFASLVYVKLKSCDQFLTHKDERWHCNVEGTGIVVYLVLIPMFAGLIAIIFTFCSGFIAKIKRAISQM